MGWGSNKKQDEIEQTEKVQINYTILNRWLEFILKGRTLSMYMQMHNFDSLMVYGGAEIGKRFVEFAISEGYNVNGIIDKKLEGEYKGILFTKEVCSNTDVIVVTPEYYFDSIEKELRDKTDAHITSVSQIIYEVG